MATTRIHVRPSVPLDALSRPPADPPPFPLAAAHRLVPGAVSAVGAAVGSLGLGPGDAVLAPAALHPRHAEALRATGVELVEHPGLWPEPGGLDDLVSARVRALLLVHQLGVPQDGRAWRAWCDERGLLLVEDASHALLAWTGAGPAGSHGHVSVFGLGATLGLPGALIVGPDAPAPDADPDADGAVDGALPAGPRLRVSAALLPRLADPGAQGRRRGHHLVLADVLGADRVAEPFGLPPEGAAPLVFPYAVTDPPSVLRRLREAGIHAVDPWGGRGPSAVGLPVHQRLTPDDLDRVARAAREADRRPPSGAPSPPAFTLETLDDLADAEPVWRELAERAGNLFATFEWAQAWMRHIGQDSRPRIVLVRDVAGRAVALLPLVLERRGPLRLLRLIGHGPADRLGPVCAPADLPLAARALRQALRELGADVFVGETLPGEDGWAGMLGAASLGRQPSPVLAVDGIGWDAFLAAKSRNFREQARRRERTLRKKHDVVFRMADDASLDRDLDTLFALHDARWEGTTATFAGDLAALHRAFARSALEQGWLRLWLLEVDGEVVAAWEGFRYAGIEWYYQSGRNPAWEKQSVGFVLLAHTVREAMDDGVREYRLLRGGEEYKGRFSTHDPGLETAVLAASPLGRAAVVGVDGVRRLPDGSRRLLKRLLG